MSKRFLVFAGNHYYPAGGWNDFRKDFDNFEEALAYANDLVTPKLNPKWNVTMCEEDWSHVVDTVHTMIVYQPEGKR